MKPNEYFAGHFDGEGCITMKASCKGSKNYSPRIAVSNVYKPVLDAYKDRYGGSVYKAKKGKNSKKQQWTWELWKHEDILIFIDSVMPHSWEKFEQLQLVKNYLNIRMKESKTHPDQAVRQLSQECYLRLRELKTFEWGG